MDPLNKLATMFAEFPGIGSRQSRRFVHFLLKRDRAYVSELVRLIEELKGSVFECIRCHRYFTKKHSEAGGVCTICADPARDHATLMIVEKDSDLEAIERSGTYHGCYFVLGGTLPILEKNPKAKIRIVELLQLIEKESLDVKEIIFACAVTPESEHTAEYVRDEIRVVAETHLITVTTLGRGLSTGTELEYSDAETLRYALEGRK
ncbi:MAG TPA: toprim domain-containing protein [Candidatus Paceibacterota bacterium]